MGYNPSLIGSVTLDITSADIPNLLRSLNEAGIVLSDIENIDLIRVRACVSAHRYLFIKEFIESKGGKITITNKSGVGWTLLALLKRPVLIVGFIIVLIGALYLPTRVYFVRVEGNQSVPTNWILEKAAECGIGFGSSRSKIRSEQMKNRLLSSIPQLQWAGVNTSGCVAVISVREKTEERGQTDRSSPNSIVAIRDGIVRSCTVSKGNPLCAVGQAVKSGQTLISGYQDCGILIKQTGAEGEVFADTDRKLTAITPAQLIKRREEKDVMTGYSILIGKKMINLYNDSGIWDTTCAKIYEEHYLTLPGGFQLPIAVVRETWIDYDCETVSCTDEIEYGWVSDAADAYLTDSMIAGKTITRNVRHELTDDKYIFYGHYFCNEMIGKAIYEEYRVNNGENN